MENGIATAIKKGVERSHAKGYPWIYWAIDLHDTITRGTYSSEKESEDFYPFAEEVLRNLSKNENMILILWTSSYPDKMEPVLKWFESRGIHFKYLNENLECPNTTYGDFSKKFFYDVMIDDRAGFVPERDWEIIKSTLINIGEWK